VSLRSLPSAQPSAEQRAAPLQRAILAQTRAELSMTLRRGESVLVTIIIPALLLFFAMTLNIAPTNGQRAIEFFVPGILVAAVMSTAMVSLSIATAYERYYGVLKRLGSSPLPRWGLIAAKTIAVLALEAAQIIFLLTLAALLYGWRPQGSFFAAVFILLLGTVTFAALGMLMAGALRAEATLAAANGLFLVFLLIGGTILPVERLPALVQPLARLLPAAAFSDALRGALSPHGVPPSAAVALAIWALIFLVAAAITFRWE
jgi:ABC-2 type transport system permease protein